MRCTNAATIHRRIGLTGRGARHWLICSPKWNIPPRSTLQCGDPAGVPSRLGALIRAAGLSRDALPDGKEPLRKMIARAVLHRHRSGHHQTRDPWGPARHLTGTHGTARGLTCPCRLSNRGAERRRSIPIQITDFLPPSSEADTCAQRRSARRKSNTRRAWPIQMISSRGIVPACKPLDQTSGQNNPYLEGVIRQGVDQARLPTSGRGAAGSGRTDAAITLAPCRRSWRRITPAGRNCRRASTRRAGAPVDGAQAAPMATRRSTPASIGWPAVATISA